MLISGRRTIQICVNRIGDLLPKVRTHDTIDNTEAIAAAGFGAAEIGVDFRSPPAEVRAALQALPQSGQRSGVAISILPWADRSLFSPGMDLADTMQQR